MQVVKSELSVALTYCVFPSFCEKKVLIMGNIFQEISNKPPSVRTEVGGWVTSLASSTILLAMAFGVSFDYIGSNDIRRTYSVGGGQKCDDFERTYFTDDP